VFQEILQRRAQPIVTPQQLAVFGRFNLPQQFVYNSSPAVLTDKWEMLLMFIDAATDEVEHMAQTACLNEQVLEVFNCFPGHEHLYNQVDALYGIQFIPWEFENHRRKDSIELLRRPVIVPSGSPLINNVVVQFNEPRTGNLVTLDPSTYTVFANCITLNVDHHWPATDRRENSVQVTYTAGYSQDDLTQVPSRLKLAILFLANHFVNVRQIVSVESSSEIGLTLCRMLSQFKSFRVPR
jgi:hypothetical protein